jgi:probable HAF family extracellular repeat protein
MNSFISMMVFMVIITPSLCEATQPASYTFMNVGTLGGSYVIAYAINENGQVAGYSYSAGSHGAHGFRTAADKPINPTTDDIGLLGTGLESNAMAINKSGQIAGWGQIPPNSSPISHAIRTGPQLPLNPDTDDLGGLGGTQAIGRGINDSGVVVGYAKNSNGTYHAFSVPSGRKIVSATDDLGSQISGASYAYGINNSGQLTGYYVNSSNQECAYRTPPGRTINPITDYLGTLGGPGSKAWDINDLGQVVGRSYITDGVYVAHAFCTESNQVINADDDLGTLSGYTLSEARAINNHGQIVGCVWNNGSDSYRAFYYNGTKMYDLNDLVQLPPHCELKEAWDINDSGQIVGRAVIGGQTQGFVLTPIPEPSTLMLIVIGTVILITYNLRRLG